MTSFLKIAQRFFVCEYFLLIPIDVPSFMLIEGQIKELQGVIPNTPWAENDQESQSRIGLSQNLVPRISFHYEYASAVMMGLIF